MIDTQIVETVVHQLVVDDFMTAVGVATVMYIN